MPAGRPTKYDPKMCDRVPELMKDGLAHEELAVELDIAVSTLYEWINKYPEFSEAVKKGEALSKAWWLKNGRISLRDKDFNYTGWYMNMKNRHKWTDRVESDNRHSLDAAEWIKKLSDQGN